MYVQSIDLSNDKELSYHLLHGYNSRTEIDLMTHRKAKYIYVFELESYDHYDPQFKNENPENGRFMFDSNGSRPNFLKMADIRIIHIEMFEL